MALYRALLPLFIYVCRSALGQSVVEVEVGAPSVTLPGTVRPLVNVPSALWTRGSEEVHRRFLKDDNFRDQNPLFTDRTQMNSDALERGNVSLELKGPTLTDSGTYRCVVREVSTEVDRFTVELRVKGLKVDVTEGSSSVSLPFPLMRTLESEVSVKWTFGSQEVHLRRGGADDFSAQSGQFKGRTQMKPDALQRGDLSLELKDLTDSDSGHYTCVVTEGSTELARTTVHLTVEPVPVITIISILLLLLLLVLLIVVLFLTHKRKNQTHESWTEALKGTVTRRPHPSTSEIIEKLRDIEKELRVREEELRVREEELRVREEELRVREEELRVSTEELRDKEKELRVEEEKLRVKEEKLRVKKELFRVKKELLVKEAELRVREEELRFREEERLFMSSDSEKP